MGNMARLHLGVLAVWALGCSTPKSAAVESVTGAEEPAPSDDENTEEPATNAGEPNDADVPRATDQPPAMSPSVPPTPLPAPPDSAGMGGGTGASPAPAPPRSDVVEVSDGSFTAGQPPAPAGGAALSQIVNVVGPPAVTNGGSAILHVELSPPVPSPTFVIGLNGDSGYRGVQYAGPIDSPSTPVCPTTAKAALDCIMTSGPGNPSYTWKNNVLVPGFLTTGAGGVGDSGNLATAGLAALYAPSPATLVVPGATPAIREAAVVFTDSTGGNFALALSSPYKAVGSDGADAGYDRFALEAAQGIVKETHVTVGAGQAVLKFTAPDGVGCPVDVSANNFQTWTRTSDPGGSRNRLIVIDNLSAATNYAYRILCQSEQVKGSFLTKASDGSATTMLLEVKPAASIGVDHVVVQSGSLPSLGSATGSTPCSTGCTVSVPASRAQVLYYNVQLFNAANALLAQSAIQAAVPE